MRNKEELLEAFSIAYNKALKERLESYLCKNFINCKYNVRHRLKKHGKIGFCKNEDVVRKASHNAFVCNDEDVVNNCQFFECKNTENTVEEDLRRIISDPSLCGQEYPKLATLIWVMQEKFIPTTRYEKFKKSLKELCKSFTGLIFLRWF